MRDSSNYINMRACERERERVKSMPQTHTHKNYMQFFGEGESIEKIFLFEVVYGVIFQTLIFVP